MNNLKFQLFKIILHIPIVFIHSAEIIVSVIMIINFLLIGNFSYIFNSKVYANSKSPNDIILPHIKTSNENYNKGEIPNLDKKYSIDFENKIIAERIRREEEKKKIEAEIQRKLEIENEIKKQKALEEEKQKQLALSNTKNSNAVLGVSTNTFNNKYGAPDWFVNIVSNIGDSNFQDWATRVAKCESGYNQYARNRTGASGLMQFMPATWRGSDNPYANNDIYNVQYQLEYAFIKYSKGRTSEWACK